MEYQHICVIVIFLCALALFVIAWRQDDKIQDLEEQLKRARRNDMPKDPKTGRWTKKKG